MSFATRACPTRIKLLRGAPPFYQVEPINDVDLVMTRDSSSQKRRTGPTKSSQVTITLDITTLAKTVANDGCSDVGTVPI